MALDAVHIRSAAYTTPVRRGLGSHRSQQGSYGQDGGWPSTSMMLGNDEHLDDHDAWRAYSTGDTAAKHGATSAAGRKPIRFVRATALSLRAIREAESLGQAAYEGEQNRRDEAEEKLLEMEFEAGEQIEQASKRTGSSDEDLEASQEVAVESNPLQTPPHGATSGMSAFYASLVKSMIAPVSHASTSTRSQRSLDKQPAPRSTFSPASQDEWFIRRAARKWDSSIANSDATVPERLFSSEDLTATHCLVCGASLPPPRSKATLQEHRRTLAHQLAADARQPLPPIVAQKSSSEATRTAKRAARRQYEADLRRLALQPGNRGYALLAQMGWAAGRALGREEWEAMGAAEDKEKPEGPEIRTVSSSGAIIDLTSPEPDDIGSVIGQTEVDVLDLDAQDDADEEQTAGAGRSESEWLTNLAQVTRHALEARQQLVESPQTSLPKPAPTPSSDLPTQAALDHRTSRGALLAPLSIEYKADRRGLGLTPLPAPPSARPRVRLRNHTDLRRGELERQGRRKKSRKEMAEEQQRELGRIRDSLR